MGEPSSSWPPLSSFQRRGDSPPLPSPPEIHPAAADLLSSSSSSELASGVETPSPMTEPPATHALASSPPPPPVSSGNAAASEQPWSPRPPSSPHRRGGRSQRFNHQRGGGGGHRNHHHHNNNGGYSNRLPAPGWRPNWGFNSVPPQYPPWGFYPGAAVGVVPPGDMNPYFVPYPQPYGEMIYPDYSVEQYAPYYDHAAYEMQYVPPMGPGMTTSIPPPSVPLVPPSFAGAGTQNHQDDKLEDKLISQIEYYFSEPNLVKDTYLRRLMDNEGWVDVHKVASFRRVAALTEDINLITDVLMSSNVVELQGNKMRKRYEWDKWILQQSSENSLLTSMQNVKLEDNLRS